MVRVIRSPGGMGQAEPRSNAAGLPADWTHYNGARVTEPDNGQCQEAAAARAPRPVW